MGCTISSERVTVCIIARSESVNGTAIGTKVDCRVFIKGALLKREPIRHRDLLQTIMSLICD